MSEQNDEPYPVHARIVYELVLYRHRNTNGQELAGEAALMLERDAQSGLLRFLHVTLLSVFDAAGEEMYEAVVKDLVLKKRLEAAVVEHYYHPPKEAIVLPRRVVEW